VIELAKALRSPAEFDRQCVLEFKKLRSKYTSDNTISRLGRRATNTIIAHCASIVSRMMYHQLTFK